MEAQIENQQYILRRTDGWEDSCNTADDIIHYMKLYLASESINDELKMIWIHTFDAFLHNMITILVFDTFQHMSVKFFHNSNLKMQ